jgi:arginine decarboxylase
MPAKETVVAKKWTVQDSREHYQIPHWGRPYFRVNDEGNLSCTPHGEDGGAIDFKALVDDLRRRGIEPPILLRFNDILNARVNEIASSFRAAMKEYDYEGDYRGVMPIKVNQQRHVVEELIKHGKEVNLGLEAGSKPELLVATALLESEDQLIVCNGYKDREYVETALYAQQLGLRPFLVVDRFAEVELICAVAKEMGVRPHIGIRLKLSTRGSGRWEESSGDRSKFGLSSAEVVRAVDRLRELEMLDCLELIHFHIGSQITAIRAVKEAIGEAARMYCDLRALGAENLTHVDVGGGLAVDYDGSKTNFAASRNYSTREYATDIVWVMTETCDQAGQPHPTLISESGRALVAHHAVLVFNVLGVHEVGSDEGIEKPDEDEHQVLRDLYETFTTVSVKNFQEAYNDALQAKSESETLFRHGVIDLPTRARLEDLFWATCKRIQRTLEKADYVPDDLDGLQRALCDTYFCNFSVFQSLPDSWAVNQLFPVVPLHRLDEEPSREAILADLTCDSDGAVRRFIDLRDVRSTLSVHPPNGEPYFLGAFLVGAYQETLGDLHNLFGDTNAVHVALEESGGYRLEHLVEGDRVSEVLRYVEYDARELVRRVRQATERAVRAGTLTLEQSRQFMRAYESGIGGYTYLEDID